MKQSKRTYRRFNINKIIVPGLYEVFVLFCTPVGG